MVYVMSRIRNWVWNKLNVDRNSDDLKDDSEGEKISLMIRSTKL